MRIDKIYILIFLLIVILNPLNAISKQTNDTKNTELTVEADNSLEWFEKEKYYLAKGNVILKKDDLTIRSNFLRANYIELEGETTLKKIIAKENVSVLQGKIKATGQHMIYDIRSKIAIITGPFQTFSSPSGYLESKNMIKFDNLENKAEANGEVKIILSNKTKIFADNVKADFTAIKKSLKSASAKGNVRIENLGKSQKCKADLGTYDSSDDIVRLIGNVVIFNKESIIKGSRGITNLKTGVSNLIADKNKKERVKGFFSLKKKKK